jgi:AcrR family transcriptional regulator
MVLDSKRRVKATRSDGERSRLAILEAAARLATVEGLAGLSLARLAECIGLSKSGLYAHFGSKEELQLAAVTWAEEVFIRDVVEPGLEPSDGLEQVTALCDRFLDYLERKVFPGGCFFAAAAAEFDTHPGPVQTQIARVHREWLQMLADCFHVAKAQDNLLEREDPSQLAFEIDAFLLMANMVFVLHDDSGALEQARSAVRSRIERARPSRRG